MTWIALTVLAALMQSIRTAGQKRLAESLDVVIVSWVRFLFGLPFACLFFIWLVPAVFDFNTVSPQFWLYVVIISCSQLLATLFAVILLGRRNFAIGSTLVKSEAIFTALLGLVLFSESLTVLAWLAVCLGIFGLFVSSLGKFNLKLTDLFSMLDTRSAYLGLGAGALFGVASVFIRQANIQLDWLSAPVTQAVVTLTCVLFLQTLIGGVFIMATRRHQLKTIPTNLPACIFIGLTSMIGSFGWFAAYALQNAAYVKTLGQIEFLFTLVLTWYYFKEKIESHEYFAMMLIFISAVVIIWEP